MQANELMVGDWVRFRHSDLAHRVVTITLHSVKIDNKNWHKVKRSLQPIPLTAEILEKNGFVHRQSVTWGDIFTYTYAIIQKDKVLQYEQHFNLSPHPYDGSGFYWIPEMSAVSALLVVYVHELQHLLRLCGIDKEINL